MATTLTLLDIAKRSNSDRAIGLVEDVITYAPEAGVFACRPVSGTSFRTTLRTGYPTVNFRQAGGGVTPSKSSFEQKLAECYFIDGQLQVPEELPDAEDGSVGDLMTGETTGVMAGAGITIGTQVYYGTTAAGDVNGFQGLVTTVGSSASLTISAGSTGTTTTSAWLVYLDIKGLHLVAGRTAAPRSSSTDPEEPDDEPVIIAPPLIMNPWSKQQVAIGTSGKVATAFVSNVKGWIGMAYGSRYSAFRIRNVGTANGTTNPWTDALGAQLLAQVPLHIRRSGKLCWLGNRQACLTLQQSRSVTSPTNQSGGATGQTLAAPFPTECQGIPIVPTDSIVNTEAAS